jgi:hypothetical protein
MDVALVALHNRLAVEPSSAPLHRVDQRLPPLHNRVKAQSDFAIAATHGWPLPSD